MKKVAQRRAQVCRKYGYKTCLERSWKIFLCVLCDSESWKSFFLFIQQQQQKRATIAKPLYKLHVTASVAYTFSAFTLFWTVASLGPLKCIWTWKYPTMGCAMCIQHGHTVLVKKLDRTKSVYLYQYKEYWEVIIHWVSICKKRETPTLWSSHWLQNSNRVSVSPLPMFDLICSLYKFICDISVVYLFIQQGFPWFTARHIIWWSPTCALLR